MFDLYEQLQRKLDGARRGKAWYWENEASIVVLWWMKLVLVHGEFHVDLIKGGRGRGKRREKRKKERKKAGSVCVLRCFVVVRHGGCKESSRNKSKKPTAAQFVDDGRRRSQ